MTPLTRSREGKADWGKSEDLPKKQKYGRTGICGAEKEGL